MPTITRTVAGAGPFNGSDPATGQVTFPPLPDDRMWRVRILGVAISSAAGAPGGATNVVFQLVPPGGVPASQNMRFVELAGPVNEVYDDCPRYVPRDDTTGLSWQLFVNLTKADTMTLTVDFEPAILQAAQL